MAAKGYYFHILYDRNKKRGINLCSVYGNTGFYNIDKLLLIYLNIKCFDNIKTINKFYESIALNSKENLNPFSILSTLDFP